MGLTVEVSTKEGLENSLDELLAFAIDWSRKTELRDSCDDDGDYARAFASCITSLQVARMMADSRAATVAELPGAKRKIWTEEDIRKARELLERGCQVWELAIHLKKEESAVRSRLRTDGELQKLLKLVKTGRWSDAESEKATLLRLQGLRVSVIAKRLGRGEVSVRRKLATMVDQIRSHKSPPAVHGPRKLSPELTDRVFQARLFELWEALARLEMTEAWRKALQERPVEYWLSSIAQNTPARVKELLAAHEPPTVAKLKELSWIDSHDAGVYGWILPPREVIHRERECYLYVGSASKYEYGLSWRRYQHLSESAQLHNRRLRALIRRKGLKRKGHFITLMMVEMDSAEKEEIVRVRHLVTLAEAMFTFWLGALENPDSLHPWTMTAVPYSGCCSHNPLTKDINAPSVEIEDEAKEEEGLDHDKP